MSFSPLPESLQERAAIWSTLPEARLLDLGCGSGEGARWLQSWGLTIWGLDRMVGHGGKHLHLRGDAHSPPIRPGSLDGVLAGNLVHHVLAQDPGGAFLNTWLDLLKSGGCLYLLGDQAEDRVKPAVRNFQKLQDLLADIQAGSRGPLVPVQRVVDYIKDVSSGYEKPLTVRWGLESNTAAPDVEAVLSFLAGAGPLEDGGRVARLLAGIRRHGLDYGRFWWVEVIVGHQLDNEDQRS